VTISEYYFILFLKISFLFITDAAQRIAIAAHAQGFIWQPPLFAAGKVPGDAEYMTLYVYAMESICH